MFWRVAATLFGIGLLLWAFFSFPLATDVFHHYSYKASVIPDSVQWSSKAINDELWRPVARVRYQVQGNTYEIKEMFQGERFRNPYGVERAIPRLNEEHKLVWYEPGNPSRATLERFFPTKKIIYSVIALALVFYAAWLGELMYRKYSR